MNQNHYAVIMAGGIGSRFWPFSRTNHPKQFHDVLGKGRSMLQDTVARFESVCPPENIYIVTNRDYYQLVKNQLPFLEDDQILLEPVGRNTAPCVAYACYKIASRNPEGNVVVAPADHVITRPDEFVRTIETGLAATAEQDILLTLGIKPSRPDTGYGYIQYLNGEAGSEIKKVKTFTEKPELEMAKEFLASGDFVWNAGIFLFNVKAILKSFEQHLPDVAEIFEEGNEDYYQEDEQHFVTKAYSQCKNISLDYGIMEKAENVYTLLSDFGWSDLGTWKSLYELSDKNGDRNVVDGNVMLYDTEGCIVKSSKDRLLVVQGLKDYIVAEYDGVVMICHKDEEQRVKQFVADAKEKQDRKFI
ncbi:mannose-1-phosphate guanylyltransferase [Catalinimonas alkaloidigena]|uniref:mannose-1-phosphate guanylyltransferase n=1 Tax=Catalinimonas alkaloidigena TaxID=1075417 RepID=A0A1G8XSQ8_9BACT|nr:mannose-1-phosphate guanylyltransferase [Catalinimonas alkaloidigena]SDJ93527.1 mannose-1-phosphate guanylyltransferase [Catalinimonas alkaloidigena]